MRHAKGQHISIGEGAGKRAAYWLGGRESDVDSADYDDDDDEQDSDALLELPGDDEVDVPEMDLDEVRAQIGNGYYDYGMQTTDDWAWEGDAMVDVGTDLKRVGEVKSNVRGMSEEIGESMEI